MDLKARIQQLASQFAYSVLDVIRQTSLDELLGERGMPKPPLARGAGVPLPAPRAAAGRAPRGGRAPSARLARRSPEDIAKTVSSITSLLKKHKGGLRAEQIRDALGLSPKEMPRPLAEGVSSRAFKKRGQKRATTYFVA
jgi:hypothetical protein